jgi:hypothetical protein
VRPKNGIPIVSAYERGAVGDSNLAHYLRCDIVTAREIVADTLTSREVIDVTGEERDVRLDLQKSLLTEAGITRCRLLAHRQRPSPACQE